MKKITILYKDGTKGKYSLQREQERVYKKVNALMESMATDDTETTTGGLS